MAEIDRGIRSPLSSRNIIFVGATVLYAWIQFTVFSPSLFTIEPRHHVPLEENPTASESKALPTKTTGATEAWKPRLIIHVGPPKTATSTVQELLTTTEWQQRLQKLDNYTYTGAFVVANLTARASRPLPINHALINDFRCHAAMSNARKSAKANQTILEALLEVPCVQNLKLMLQSYHQNNQSLIFSDESLGFKAFSYHQIPVATSLDWISLKHLLGQDWNITVLIGYRRYFEWLPSAKQQVERWTPNKPKMNRFSGGRVPQPLFPDYWKLAPGKSAELPYFFTDQLVTAIQPYFSVHVLDLRNVVQTIEADFLCAGGALRSCHVAAFLPARISNPSISVFYDSLVMAAFESGMFLPSASTKRRDVVVEAQKYDLERRNDSTKWPLICPTRAEHEAYLEVSIDAERRVWGVNDRMEAKHRQDFWDAVKKEQFCHVDTKACLKQDMWQKFFNSIQDKDTRV